MPEQKQPIVLDELQTEFLNEISFMLDSVEECFLTLEKPDGRNEQLNKIFRVVHSIKGAAGSVGFEDLSAFGHVLEDLLSVLRVWPHLVDARIVDLLLKALDLFKLRVSQLRSESTDDWFVDDVAASLKSLTAECNEKAQTQHHEEMVETALKAPAEPHPHDDHAAHKYDESRLLKIDTSRVAAILELVGELVTVKSQILEAPTAKTDGHLRSAAAILDKTVRELQHQSLGLRMTSLKSTFQKLQRIVRDLSSKLGKPVNLSMYGEDTEIDRTMTELLADPLVHLIRNAIDHGIEDKAKRLSAGKTPLGEIQLSARQKGGRILIEIRDDGAGINREKVIAKARANGIIAANRLDEDISDSEAFNFIFSPGFSTADAITDVSGRGVGLDVVKSNIQRLKGMIETESWPGEGTRFRLSLPLTTSIMDGMVVEDAGQRFVLPLEKMRELVRPRDMRLFPLVSGTNVVNVRDRLIPFLKLSDVLKTPGRETLDSVAWSNETLVLMETADTPIALGITRVISQTQVVLKSLEKDFKNHPELSGGAIMADGTVALVLDVDGLVNRFAQLKRRPDLAT